MGLTLVVLKIENSVLDKKKQCWDISIGLYAIDHSQIYVFIISIINIMKQCRTEEGEKSKLDDLLPFQANFSIIQP